MREQGYADGRAGRQQRPAWAIRSRLPRGMEARLGVARPRTERSAMTYTIESDALYPRDADHRYRIYARRGRELEILASAPDAGGVGQALITLHEDEKEAGRRLADRGTIGVLDVMAGGPTGEWIVLPWERGHGSP